MSLLRVSGMVQHLQEMFLSGCSAVDLLRLATANRAMEKMAIEELGWRRVEVVVTRLYDGKTKIEVGERGRKSSLHVDWKQMNKFIWVILLLAKNVRQMRLIFTDYTLHQFLDDERMHFRIDYLQYPRGDRFNHDLLKFFTPRHLKIVGTPEVNSREPDDMNAYGDCAYVYRGIQNAEILELDERCVDPQGRGRYAIIYNTPAIEYLRVLLAPSLHLSVHSRISDDPVFEFVEKWQSGRRSVVAFTANLRLARDKTDVSPDVRAFADNFPDYIDKSKEIEYPQEDVIPASILEHFRKSIEEHGDSDEQVALEVSRRCDGRRLKIVLRRLTEHLAALGIYEAAQ